MGYHGSGGGQEENLLSSLEDFLTLILVYLCPTLAGIANSIGRESIFHSGWLTKARSHSLCFFLLNLYFAFKRTSLSTGIRDDKKENRFVSVVLTLWSSR